MLQKDILAYPTLKHVYQVGRLTTMMQIASKNFPTIFDSHVQ
jgi:hypothetical protein